MSEPDTVNIIDVLREDPPHSPNTTSQCLQIDPPSDKLPTSQPSRQPSQSSDSDFLPDFTIMSTSSDELPQSPPLTPSTLTTPSQSISNIEISPFSSSHTGRTLWFQQTLQPPSQPSPSAPLSPSEIHDQSLDEQHNNSDHLIDKNAFIEFVTRYGVPENKRSLRSLTWKLLLNYLPFDKSKWAGVAEYKRAQYHTWVREFVVNPYSDLDKSEAELHRPVKERKNKNNKEGSGPNPDNNERRPVVETSIPNMNNTSIEDANNQSAPVTPQTTNVSIKNKGKVDQWVLIDPDDDPLSIMALAQSSKKADQKDYDPYTDLSTAQNPNSNSTSTQNLSTSKSAQRESQELAQRVAEKKNKWAQYYLDEEIRAEIDKDVLRTYSTLHFFQKPVHPDDQEMFDKQSARASRLDIDQHNQLINSQVEQHSLLSSPSQSNMPQSQDENKPVEVDAQSKVTPKASAQKKATTSHASLFGEAFSAPKDTDDDDIDPFAVDSNSNPSSTAKPAQKSERSLHDDLFLGIKSTKKTNDNGVFDHSTLGEDDIKYSDLSTIRVNTTVAKPVTSSVHHHRPLCHHDVLRRLLFLYAKLNPGVRYVQGMNEILAPIYYVFASDPDHLTTNPGRSLRSRQRLDELIAAGQMESPEYQELISQQDFSDAEADTFFVFSHLMSEIRDRYIKSLDSSEFVILSIAARFIFLLHDLDFQLWSHLSETAVDPRYYSFRWITLLLSQDFDLPDVFRLWDSLFADSVRFVPLCKQSTIPMLVTDQCDPTSPTQSPPSSFSTPHPSPKPSSQLSPYQQHQQQQQQPNQAQTNNKKPNKKTGTALNEKEAKKLEIMSQLYPADPCFRFELYICCAMLVNIRDELIGCDFTECLYSIHHYPEDKRDIDRIINIAHRLRKQHLYGLWEKSQKAGLLTRAGNKMSNFIDRHHHNDENNTSQPTQSPQQQQQQQQQSNKPTQSNQNSNITAPPPPQRNQQQALRNQPNTKQESSIDQFVNWLKR